MVVSRQKSKIYKYEKLVEDFLEFQQNIYTHYNTHLLEIDFSSVGESMFYCGLIYKKLDSNFQALRTLISFGFYYEAYSLIRQMLEQIAFAFEIFHKQSIDEFDSPTKSISILKRFYSYAGSFYGLLSSKTHIDKTQFINHYTVNEQKEGTVLLRSLEFSVEVAFFSSIILDIYVCVFEYVFSDTLNERFCLTINKKFKKSRPTKTFHSRYKKKYLKLLRQKK